MFPLGVDDLIMSLMQENQFQTQLQYVILFLFEYNVWDEITYPFLNFNGCTVEV